MQPAWLFFSGDPPIFRNIQQTISWVHLIFFDHSLWHHVVEVVGPGEAVFWFLFIVQKIRSADLDLKLLTETVRTQSPIIALPRSVDKRIAQLEGIFPLIDKGRKLSYDIYFRH